MSNRLGHSQKLNPADIAPEPPEQLDLLVADLTDSQILDDRAIQDTLESDFYSPPIENSQDDIDEIDIGATTAIKVRQAMAILEDATEGSTVLHHYQPKSARASWMQRVASWIRSLGR